MNFLETVMQKMAQPKLNRNENEQKKGLSLIERTLPNSLMHESRDENEIDEQTAQMILNKRLEQAGNTPEANRIINAINNRLYDPNKIMEDFYKDLDTQAKQERIAKEKQQQKAIDAINHAALMDGLKAVGATAAGGLGGGALGNYIAGKINDSTLSRIIGTALGAGVGGYGGYRIADHYLS